MERMNKSRSMILPRNAVRHSRDFNLLGLSKSTMLEPKYLPTTMNERPSLELLNTTGSTIA